jgi:putative transposase
MRPKPTTGNRRSIRLKEFDYSAPGAYFVTICTHNRLPLFRDQHRRDLVDRSWLQVPSHFPTVRLDEMVVMPDHIHFIVFLTDSSETVSQGAPRRAPTLADVVRAFKGDAAREINRLRRTPGSPVWQRNYYEHIVRDEAELARIREYIRNNPRAAHSHDDDDQALAWEQL